MNHAAALPTDEDFDIRHGLRVYRGNPHGLFRNLAHEDRDAALVARLLRARKNNRAARAFAGAA